jgi:DNA-binding transcriptional regulator YbjK
LLDDDTAHVAFAPDGRTLVLRRRQKTIPVWETATGRQRLVLEGHGESMACFAYAPDGRTLASSGWDNTTRLWDLGTGQELRRLEGHRGKAHALTFSPDAKTLVSAGDDTTFLFWNVADLTGRARALAGRLSAEELEARWEDLTDRDAAKAHRAVTSLSATPEQAVPLFQKYLRRVRAPEAQHLARLVRDLDDDRFPTRERAAAELEQLAELAEPALRQKLTERPTPELQRRVEQLLARLESFSPDQLRVLRAVEVLEQTGTPEARRLLEALSEGASGALLTREATAAVRRLLRSQR